MDRRQLQEMLREMRVSFSPEATEAELAELLRQENRRQWAKASALREVKTRKKSEKDHVAPPLQPPTSRGLRPKPGPTAPTGRKLTHRGMIQKRPAAPRTPQPAARQSPGGPVLPEAAEACDLCAKSSREPGGALSAYSFSDQPALRNTVFLCPGCTEAVKAQKDGGDIRALKRKARRRADARLQVSYGKVKHTWGYKP